MKIRLHIERIVLDGMPLSPGERGALSSAIQVELSQLLAAGMLPELGRGAVIDRLQAPAIHLGPGGGAGSLGRQIARSVYSSLGASAPSGGMQATGMRAGTERADR
jgi:hypothetical protein